MGEDFSNIYDDDARARAYARLEFPGTYYLAYRDLPSILERHVQGRRALDFGCGTGRSTRFLRGLGFDVVGVDVAEPMLARARSADPRGDYRRITTDDPGGELGESFDLVFSAFTFDNIPGRERKVVLFQSLAGTLNAGGRVVSLVSTPDIYLHEWASFSTRDYPGNRTATNGDKVRIVMLDVEDPRPVEDVMCTDEEYRKIYQLVGLEPIATFRPLGNPSEPFRWVSETEIAPWAIYVLAHRATP